MAFKYPAARRDPAQVDEYHGTKISDPYAWLEDPDSPDTMAFVEQQNQLTMPYLESCGVRARFQQRLTELYDYPKYSCPYKRGSRYFYFHNKGLQNQDVLYVQDSLDAAASVFFDPNTLSEDGTVALKMGRLSEECEYFAYGLSSSGSDWVTLRFLKADGLTELPDVLERVKFSCLAWTHDARGIFYNCYPRQEGKTDGTETTANMNQKLYYHVIGTKQSEDVLVAEFPDHPRWHSSVTISDDGRYAVLSITEGCKPVNQLWYCDLQELQDGIKGLLPWVKLVDNFEAQYSYVTNEGSVFTFRTNLDAPRYRLINIDIQNPDRQKWSTLIPQHEKDVLGFVSCVNQRHLLVNYVHDVKDILQLFHLPSGRHLRDLPLDVGTIAGVSCKKKHSEFFYKFSSFTTPGIIYHCDLSHSSPEPRIFREVEVKGIDQEDFQTSQVFYPSKDGTRIPMFLVHAKNLKKDGTNPVFLYGYGGFEASIQPYYKYSPLHNLPEPPYSGPPYPAVLLLTADHDDRVVPLHTLKFCAALQHGVGSSPQQRQPLMVRVDTRSGHGAGKPTAKAILEDTHVFAFIAQTLGLSWAD
ncbi:prolyl endopeptidase isoform 2-T2 [Fundulus diaphanus]